MDWQPMERPARAMVAHWFFLVAEKNCHARRCEVGNPVLVTRHL